MTRLIWYQLSLLSQVFSQVLLKAFKVYNGQNLLCIDSVLTPSLFSHQFLYALPRDEGYEFFLGQWSGQELHFTSLINIQVRLSSWCYFPVGFLVLSATNFPRWMFVFRPQERMLLVSWFCITTQTCRRIKISFSWLLKWTESLSWVTILTNVVDRHDLVKDCGKINSLWLICVT